MQDLSKKMLGALEERQKEQEKMIEFVEDKIKEVNKQLKCVFNQKD